MSDGGFASRGPAPEVGRGVAHAAALDRDLDDPAQVRAELAPVLAEVHRELEAVAPALEVLASCEQRHELEQAKGVALASHERARRACLRATQLVRRHDELQPEVDAARAKLDASEARVTQVVETRELRRSTARQAGVSVGGRWHRSRRTALRPWRFHFRSTATHRAGSV